MYKFDAGLVNENPKGLCVAAAIQNNKSEREGGGGHVCYLLGNGRMSFPGIHSRESGE